MFTCHPLDYEAESRGHIVDLSRLLAERSGVWRGEPTEVRGVGLRGTGDPRPLGGHADVDRPWQLIDLIRPGAGKFGGPSESGCPRLGPETVAENH